MSLEALLFLLLLFLLSLLFFVIERSNGRGRKKLPPGPMYWPLLGNISFNNTQKIHSSMKDLEARYGPIFTLERGKKPFIIVTSSELIREALVEKGQIFCSRPHSAGQPTIGSTPQGPLWRALRKNFATHTLNPAANNNNVLRSFRRRAMQSLVDRITAEAAQNGGVVGVEENIRIAVFGIMLFMCFGMEMDVDFACEFQRAMADVLREAKILSTGYAGFPLGSFFRRTTNAKHVKQILSRGGGMVVSLVERRRQMLRQGGRGSAYLAYVDTLFDMELSDAEVAGLCAEFVHAGSHTTSTALQFLLGNLANNPHVQANLHEEVVGAAADAGLEEAQVGKMEYVEAVVMETLRRHIPGYFTLPYSAMQDCTLGGWHVPAGAAVNLYKEGMTKDPRLWEKPWEFWPERFLDADVDVMGTKEMKMIPFGTGRRMCPGLNLAMTHLRLIAAPLVKAFEWKCIHGHPVDLSEMDGFLEVMESPVRSLRKPFQVMALPRLVNAKE